MAQICSIKLRRDTHECILPVAGTSSRDIKSRSVLVDAAGFVE
jgi:hypothetical protein